MTEKWEVGFCIKKIERLSECDYSITVVTESGREIFSKARVTEVKSGGGKIRKFNFTSQDFQDAMNKGEIIAKPITELLGRLDRMTWPHPHTA